MKINNRRYLGNKYKLLPFIKETIDKECKDIDIFFDVFSGTGSVSSAFVDKKLITNDILYSNYLSHLCWFSNEEYDEEKVKNMISKFNSCKPKKENYMSENFTNTFFSHDVCLKIGYIREEIEKKFKKKEINNKERAMLITSLLYACDKISNTCGHYDAYRKGAEYNDNFVMEYPEQFTDLKDNECYCENANKLVKSIKCDLAYLDPPYNSRQYSDAYHLLENIARWEKPEVVGIAKKMDRTKLKSDYCTTKATEAFENLVNNLNCKYIVLSYNNTSDKANERSNARITDEAIIKTLSKRGEVKIYTKAYKAFTTGKSDNHENEERLFVCKVLKPIYNDFVFSPLNYTGGKVKLLPQILPLFPKKINRFVDLFCGGCNVGLNVDANKYFYNDVETNLINMFKLFKDTSYDSLLDDLQKIITKYHLSQSKINGYAYYGCNSSDGLAKYNKPYYKRLKDDFNNLKEKNKDYYEMFYLLIVYGFNNQIRFNSKNEFNLPVGKRDLNSKLERKLHFFVDKLRTQNIVFSDLYFSKFNEPLGKDDLVYCDPPYLIATASYNENNGWTDDDEKKLLKYLDELNSKNVKFALSNVLVHKGKQNTILNEWITSNGYIVHHLNKNYNNSNYHNKNNDKETDEVLIVNYL